LTPEEEQRTHAELDALLGWHGPLDQVQLEIVAGCKLKGIAGYTKAELAKMSSRERRIRALDAAIARAKGTG